MIAETRQRTVRVVLVEDDEDYVMLVREGLAGKGPARFDLKTAGTLRDALSLLSSEGADVAVCDLSLPDAQGIETFEKLKAAHPSLPIIVLSGFDDESIAVEAVRKGAQDYLAKRNFDASWLVRTILYAIERNRIRRKLDLAMRKLRDANAKLHRLAVLDPLTDLLNRRGLERVLSNGGPGSAHRAGEGLVAMLIDLDRFKEINDTWGHAVGDVVLKEISARLKDSLRGTDYAARVGGDEFVVLLPETRPAEAVHVAEKLRLAISGITVLASSGENVHVTASIGLVPLGDGSGVTVEELMSRSHTMMARSKSGGRNRVSFNPVAGSGPSGREPATLAEVRDRLRRGGSLRAVSQPIFDIRRGVQTACELLSRSTVEGYEMPSDFFEVCLEDSALTTVDLECLERCLATAERLPPAYVRHVNLFPSTIVGVPASRITSVFERVEHRGRFCVEISEQQIIGNPSYLSDRVDAFRRAGLQIAIDDVGFGRSCLESLVLLEPDIAKIDRRCVQGIARDERRVRALRRIISAAGVLGAEIIAEGIENADDLEVLKALGVRYGQGFLFGAPKSVEMGGN